MNAIVNVDKNWGIGNKGELLISIPADMKMFREETTGNVIVLGRKTMETFPAENRFPTGIILYFQGRATLRYREPRWFMT